MGAVALCPNVRVSVPHHCNIHQREGHGRRVGEVGEWALRRWPLQAAAVVLPPTAAPRCQQRSMGVALGSQPTLVNWILYK